VNWISALLQGVLLGGLYSLFACGLSLLFGTMQVINLSHGDMAVVAAYVALGVVAVTSIPAIWSFVIVVPVFAVLGYALQRTLLQASLARGLFTTLLVTFGLSIIIQNALLEIFSADSRRLNPGGIETASVALGGQLAVGWLPLITLTVAVAILLGLQGLIARLSVGRAFRATSDDQETAELMGIDNRRIYGLAMALSLGIVAVAGVFLGIRTTFTFASGPDRLLFAFEAVIIGGLGSLWGTLVGGAVLGVAQTVGARLSPGWGILTGHLVFLAVLLLRPRGLFSKARRVA
jgi:branched-chain amino acid transport system permease protein